MIGTISPPDAQALRETDLDPSLDPWAEIERLKRGLEQAMRVLKEGGRGYTMFEDLGTRPNVIYLKKVDKEAEEPVHA